MLLLTNFSVLQEINAAPFLLVIGVFVTTFSSAAGCLACAVQILAAIAKDRIFGMRL